MANEIIENRENYTIADIVREMRDGSIYDENGGIDLHEIADSIEAAHERETVKLVVAIRSMRSQLYGLAASIRSITGWSDARERGVHYSEVQNIAAQIENIADNGGRV